MKNLSERFARIRARTLEIVKPLAPEDTVVQPVLEVSPPKWHLAHSTWFFETFVLQAFNSNYKIFNHKYNFLFNSYYESIGERVPRHKRGTITRPGLQEILDYRAYVDFHLLKWLAENLPTKAQLEIIELGLQHEQQHQELLVTDIKYILGKNPVNPVIYSREGILAEIPFQPYTNFINIPEGIYEIGHNSSEFCFDNELGRHKQFLHSFSIAEYPVTNAEYLDFINDDGYSRPELWLSDGWEWVKNNQANAPLYWQLLEQQWHSYSFSGLTSINPMQPVCHVNLYEADAFAQWKGMRLPTEFEWEIACKFFPGGSAGQVWEWTNSAYLPYPNFKKSGGAIGEYNGKFMMSQMVLRGGSVASPENHIRPTYRNFFPPDAQWQFSGIRLARHNQ